MLGSMKAPMRVPLGRQAPPVGPARATRVGALRGRAGPGVRGPPPVRIAAPRSPSPMIASMGTLDSSDAECPVFIDRNGEMIEVMCCDYGMRSGVQRMYSKGGAQIPVSAWKLAWANFAQEWAALRRSFRYGEYGKIAKRNPPKGAVGKVLYGAGDAVVRLFSAIDERLEESGLFSRLLPKEIPKEVFDPKTGGLSRECREIRAKLKTLKLDNAAVWAREHAREAGGGGVDTPWLVRAVYLSLCVFLDVAYDNRPMQRFWFLETVARMPYFSYLSCLHMLETLGWWRAGAELRKVHFAEEWNELHHLQIMESLGGDQLWVDRFMAQHAAIIYYWILVVLFFFSPQLAYNFSELIEAHAVDTYGEFADANEELLRSLPPPLVAAEYYSGSDLYLFDVFQTGNPDVPRRPPVRNLYDVFINIRDDEGEHVKTMVACQDFSVGEDLDLIKERQTAAGNVSLYGSTRPEASGSADNSATNGGGNGAANGAAVPRLPPRLQGRGAEPKL